MAKFLSKNRRMTAVLFGLLLLCPLVTEAKTMHAGLPSDQLWFSKDPFFAGDTITVFTLVFNSSNYRLSGTMTLKDGTTTVDKKPFVVDPKGGSQIVTFPWQATKGNHSFSAIITEDQLSENSGVLSDTVITATHTPKVMRFADDDKNGNGIGDSLEPPPPKLAPVQAAATTAPALPSSTEVRAEEKALLEHAPTPIINASVPILGAVEDFRVFEAKKAQANLLHIENKIGTQGSSTDRAGAGWKALGSGIGNGEIARTPFDYLKLFIALIIHFFTANPYAFYIVLLLLLYKLIRILIGLFF